MAPIPRFLSDDPSLFVDDVEAVVQTLDPAERERAIILAPSYGHAGAIELFGRGFDHFGIRR